MKHLLTLLAFLAVFVGSHAQATGFEEPAAGTYADGYAVIVQLNINGEKVCYLANYPHSIELAAFVDGDCRAVISQSKNVEAFNEDKGFFIFRVWGKEEEIGKTVSFKAIVDGVAYKFNSTIEYGYDGKYDTTPLVLNLDMITGMSFPEEINIRQPINSTYDLWQKIIYSYTDSKGDDYTPLNESSIDMEETRFIYELASSSNSFSIDPNLLLTINNPTTPGDGDAVSVFFYAGGHEFANANTTINITIPVQTISIPESFSCWKGDDLFDVLEDQLKLSPEDVSKEDLVVVVVEGNQQGITSNGYCSESGEYLVKISSPQDNVESNQFKVTVQQHVESISASELTLTVNLGENVYDAIKKLVTVYPANATNKNLKFSSRGTDYINEKGVAVKETGENGVTVMVTSEDNANAGNLYFTVVVTNNVTSITATPNEVTVYVGENVYTYLNKHVNITISPSTADQTAYSFEPSQDDIMSFPNYMAVEIGTYKWIAKSRKNTDITTEITVIVKKPVNLSCDNEVNLTIFTPGVINLTIESGGDDFDPSLVDIELESTDMAEITKGDDGLSFSVTGKKVGETIFNVIYNGESLTEGNLKIGTEIQLGEGWNWISNNMVTDVPLTGSDNNTGNQYLPEYFEGDTKIKEVRSENALLFNDDTYGVFGRISALKGGEMYKVQLEGSQTINIPVYGDLSSPTVSISRTGYSWIAYPIVGNHSMVYFNENGLLSAGEGDQIIGKDGFAEYKGGKWNSASDFMLETGKGYIYYNNNQNTFRLSFGDSYVEEETSTAGAKSFGTASNVWEYNSAAYPETMCIVAKVKGVEPSDKYSVGAFVNGECRGKGTYVTDDVMFISVAGQNGDVVSFKLYNSETEDYTDIPEMMSYTLKKGSLASPVQITATETTGINELPAADNEEGPAYNLAGQRVRSSAKGIVLRGNKKYVNR